MRQDLLCSHTISRIVVEPHNLGEVSRWGSARTFPHFVHPRSFAAIRFRMSQLEQYNPCLPDSITEVSELTDQTYQSNVNISQSPSRAPAEVTAPPVRAHLVGAVSSAASAYHNHRGHSVVPE